MTFDALYQPVSRLLRWVLLAGATGMSAGALAQAIGPGQGVGDGEILLGYISDLSGPVASVGGPTRGGMIMQVKGGKWTVFAGPLTY